MHAQHDGVALAELGALRIRGADAVAYLQGQLSQNIERISRERSLQAGFHNAQGRVIALLRLVLIEDHDLLAILPRELASPVATRLSRFVLRAKVRISDESSAWHVRGFIGDAAGTSAWPRSQGAQAALGQSRIVCVSETPHRWICVSPGAAAESLLSPEIWQRHEIEAGEPQVFAATSESFVSQMLNLDLIDAIAFDKGCYTGQEIIARAHYRGRMKRRMQRFSARASALAPGDRGQLADGRGFSVVRALVTGDRVDFLAVASLPAANDPSPGSSATAGPVIDAVQEPLPYVLPA
jgi:tRNA-modifying protein YgfZ